jgi:hypothetical protein
MDQFQSEDKRMTNQYIHEKLVEKKVTYALLKDDKFYIIENVPARVNEETGEQLILAKGII